MISVARTRKGGKEDAFSLVLGRLGITAFVAFLLALAIHSAHHNPVAQLEREIDRLKQRGEPTRFHDLLPPVNPSQDGTPFYQLAIAQLETIQKQHPKSFWDNLYQFGTKPVNLADVEKALKVVQPALKTFRQALHYPHMRRKRRRRFTVPFWRN